jgi:hypothetical protein
MHLVVTEELVMDVSIALPYRLAAVPGDEGNVHMAH